MIGSLVLGMLTAVLVVWATCWLRQVLGHTIGVFQVKEDTFLPPLRSVELITD